MNYMLLSILSILSWISIAISGAVVVKEVLPGHIAELPCLSNDDNHRFMFWELSDGKNVISPGNIIDKNKYRYDVWTGKLSIRSVSTSESGFYRCISQGLEDNSAINIQAVELLVKKDWEDLWENDFETNLLRSLTAVMVIVVLIAAVLYIISSKRRRESRKYFDIDVSRENSPPIYARGSQGGSGGVIRAVSPPGEEVGIDNSVDVDFPKVFTKMHQDQGAGMS